MENIFLNCAVIYLELFIICFEEGIDKFELGWFCLDGKIRA